MDLLNISQCEYEFYNIELYQPTIKELAKIFKQEEDLIFTLKLLISPLRQTLNLENEELTEFQIFLGLLMSDTSSFGLTSSFSFLCFGAKAPPFLNSGGVFVVFRRART